MVDREYPGQEPVTSQPNVQNAERVVDPPRPDDEISFVEMANVLLRQRTFVLGAIVLFVGISLVIALTRPTRYTSSASFLPESSDGSRSGASALAQQFGVALRGSGVERSPQFYAIIVTSSETLRQVATRRYSLSPAEEGPEEIDLITYYEVDSEIHEVRIEKVVRNLSDDLSVSTDIETGIVTFSVRTSDPMLSQGVAAVILELVNDFDLTSRQSQARAERLFAAGRLTELTSELREAEDSLQRFLLENRLFDSPPLQFERDRLQRDVTMRQELVTSLARAFENARIEEVRNTPMITLIESPRVPALRDGKGRVTIVLVGTFTGAMFGVFLAFVRNYREEERMKDSP